MPQENQRIALTKRLLREGMLRLLKTKPIEKINVSELCKEAGINRATFYRHYTLPRDVLFELESELIQNVRALFPKPNNLQEAEQQTVNMLTYLYDRADTIKLLIACKSDENFTHVINEFYYTFVALKSEIRGIRDLDNASARLLSTYCVGGIYFLLRQWLVEEIDKTPQEISHLIFQFIDKGLAF